MLVQTDKTEAQRHYEAEVAEAFARYDEVARHGTDFEQADARREYVDAVHAIRRQWHDIFVALDQPVPSWLPAFERPVSGHPPVEADEAPAPFVAIGLVFVDVTE